ncbi:hypothetical protein NQ315_013692 [Exocentrus adspersus]|uniref:Uncharacterized protein n=1 Tax=Exocentrus adspersus TaxID=1586481 RepID=A0AAV8W3U6_9CUCU|nr:hypothetical protein NQ315_013692 [Exocentrus adspersus]
MAGLLSYFQRFQLSRLNHRKLKFVCPHIQLDQAPSSATKMTESVEKLLEAKNKFIGFLKEDADKNNRCLSELKEQRDKLQQTIANVKDLGKSPEHTALIPLAKNIYMKGKIVHTGEYYIKSSATPESYFVLKTLAQTIDSLEQKVQLKEKDIQNAEYNVSQLAERMKILTGIGENDGVLPADEELPKEIKSEKGTAVKVGDFYEILEYEED